MKSRVCARCKDKPPVTDNAGRGSYCDECNAARAREWRAANVKKVRKANCEKRTEWLGVTYEKPLTRNAAGNRQVRLEAIAAYGGHCVCCKESQQEFLTIDHVDGGGNKHRKTLTDYFYRWLKNNGFPKKEFRLLCYNCNCSRAHRGYCPHERA